MYQKNIVVPKSNWNRPWNTSVGATIRLAMAFAVSVAVPAGQPDASAATITIDAETHGDAFYIRASTVLNADAATAWLVLTDYNRYPEFIPDLRVSRIVARSGATVTVEQSGDAVLWLFKLPIDITFEINEFPPKALRSRAVAGSLRALTSSYTLTPVGTGVRLDYEGHVAPRFEFFGDIEQAAMRQDVTRQFQALADEIERRSAAIEGHRVAEAH